MPRVIGFTATREPLTDEQREWVWERLCQYVEVGAFFHHGDCVGGDEYGFEVARGLGYVTVAHPPDLAGLRAFTSSDVVLEPRPYLERDRAIVDACTLLLAVPRCAETDAPRSGTWTTVRYARRVGCPTRNWWYERSAQ